jgi:hypothetical protein
MREIETAETASTATACLGFAARALSNTASSALADPDHAPLTSPAAQALGDFGDARGNASLGDAERLEFRIGDIPFAEVTRAIARRQPK